MTPPPATGDAPPARVRLVVLFGGRSAEHDISCVSASHVLRAVDPARYQVVPVAIGRDGRWRLADAAAELLAAGRAVELPASISPEGTPVDPLPQLAGDGAPTVVLPILHGPNGEDGTVQGLLELAGVPYVGSGVLGSAVSMDKAMAKTVLDAEGIPQVAWRRVDAADLDRPGLVEDLTTALGEVVFVKPANMGSSIGVSKVKDPGLLRDALEEAFAYDDVAVVEEAVVARELECGVLGNLSPRASVVGEVLPAAEFYDFDDKYADGVARTVIPAELPGDVAEDVRALAVRTYRALRCEGMARVDCFWEEGGRGLLVNEVNTIPGFTPISMFPQLWEASGLGYAELVDELVRLALDRHARRGAHSVERRFSGNGR